MKRRILITGGAGFVGSYIAKSWKKTFPIDEVIVLDNLKRRGSELNIGEFKKYGILFQHGDIRNASDLEDLNATFDLVIEASAEPSVLAGLNGQSPRYLLDTNLMGTLNCLEYSRKNSGGMIFLSTSRVYSIPALKSIALEENDNGFEVKETQLVSGITRKGISENFPTIGNGFRSLYGTTKLASELFCQEYSESFNFPVCVNRCGVLAGPGQFGKTDQGVFTLWVANHYFKKSLRYTGFGGEGKQIRDILHPHDLFELILKQFESLDSQKGEPLNVGGGEFGSVSLKEYTQICQEVTGNKIVIQKDISTSPVDIPYYVSDSSKIQSIYSWKPQVSPRKIVQEIYSWIQTNENFLSTIF